MPPLNPKAPITYSPCAVIFSHQKKKKNSDNPGNGFVVDIKKIPTRNEKQ